MCAAALVVAEDEELAAFNRSAERAAEDVLDEHWLCDACFIAEEVIGVERLIADVVEEGAMGRIGAGSSDQFSLGAGVASVLRFAAGGNYAKFFHRVGIRRGHSKT